MAITLRENKGSALTHSEMDANFNEILLAVSTVADFPADPSNLDTVIVTDENQGGVFIYRTENASVNNGGTIFNGWTRQYDGAVSVKWFDANETRTDNEVPIQAALDYVRNTGLDASLSFSPITYTTAGKITIHTNSSQQQINIDFNNATINYTGTDTAIDVGLGAHGLFRSKLSNLNLVATASTDNVLVLTGEGVRDSEFNNIYIKGGGSTTKCGLLIMGEATYFNKFNNILLDNLAVGISINYDVVSSAWNPNSNLANANRFNQISFYDIHTTGIILGATVGNNLQGLEFDHSVAGCPLDIRLLASPAQVTTNNIIVGRFESGATTQVYVGTGCRQNYLQIMLTSVVTHETAADAEFTQIVQVGSDSVNRMHIIQPKYYAGMNNALYFLGNEKRFTLADTQFAPWAESSNSVPLGASGQTWSKLWLGNNPSNLGIINAKINDATFSFTGQNTSLYAADLFLRAEDNLRGTSGDIRTFNLTADGGMFMIRGSDGGIGVYIADWLTTTITAVRSHPSFQLTSTPDTNKYGIYKGSETTTISFKQNGTPIISAFRIAYIHT